MSHVPAELVCLARGIVARLSRTVAFGGSATHAALIASQLYEVLQRELAGPPRLHFARTDAIAAAIDRCRRAGRPGAGPATIEAELREALVVLESGMRVRRLVNGAPVASQRSRPRLRLIAGGLSQSA